jgi:CRISPR/Cas system-associated exonuclease Cas4 (RecB family)
MGRDIEAMVIDNLIRGAEGKLELVKFGDEDQTPVYLGSLKGHPDILLKDTETGEYILVEVKSAAQTSFNEAKAKGVKKAQPNHYTQLVAYMCALRDTYNIKVAYGIYLMVKKSGNPPTMRDAAMIYEEVVHWDSREEAKIYLKVEQIEALTKEVEPDPPYDTPNKECSMCPVSHLCPLMIGE